MTIIPLYSGPPKRDIIELAFEDCGSTGYEFERTPDEVASALRKLNMLMAEWKSAGIDLCYNQPDYGAGLPEDLSGIPLDTVNAVAQYLAMRIAPQMGVALSGEQKATANASMLLLQARFARNPRMRFAPNTPRGSGHRYWPQYPFTIAGKGLWNVCGTCGCEAASCACATITAPCCSCCNDAFCTGCGVQANPEGTEV